MIKIFRKKFIALIDTGATSSAFDMEFVKEYTGNKHFQLLDEKAGGLGDTNMIMFATELRFQLGDAKFDQAVALIDYTHIHQLYEMHGLNKFHFIIGNDILLRSQAIINYKSKTMSLELNPFKLKK